MALHVASQQLPFAVTLTGECNKCGLCCAARKGGQWLFCRHLLIVSEVGTPDATRCTVHAQRWDGMPIEMVSQDGSVRVFARCHKDSPEETAKIVQAGIGKGCSLTVRKE